MMQTEAQPPRKTPAAKAGRANAAPPAAADTAVAPAPRQPVEDGRGRPGVSDGPARERPHVPPIPQSAMQDAAFARNWWRVVIDGQRTPYENVLTDVAVWAPNEAKLRAGDLVEVLDEQSTLFALLYLVEHVPGKCVRFAELIKAPLGGVAVGRIEARGHHYAQWRGPAKRWCIIGPTGTVVRDGILSKDEAERDATTRNMPASMAFVSHPRM